MSTSPLDGMQEHNNNSKKSDLLTIAFEKILLWPETMVHFIKKIIFADKLSS